MKTAAGSRYILPLLILLNLAVVGAFHISLKKGPDQKEIREITEYVQESKNWDNRVAPDFELPLSNGKTFRLSDEVGKSVILLNFFATWCAPCREEMPELNRYYLKHKDQHFVMIGVDANETKDLVDRFVSDLKIPFPVGIDQRNIQFLYAVSGFPTTVVIGVDGRVHYYQSGSISNADVAFNPALEAGEEMLRSNKGTNKERYLAELAADPGPKRKEETGLTGRAKDIALKMDCVCGCSDKVLSCGCSTADKIVKKLKTEKLDGKTDEEIILALNKEFCVGAKDQ